MDSQVEVAFDASEVAQQTMYELQHNTVSFPTRIACKSGTQDNRKVLKITVKVNNGLFTQAPH